MATTSSGTKTPWPTASNKDRGSGTPSGLTRTRSFASGPGRNAAEITPRPTARPATAATGHHRRDGSRPSGNHKTPNVTSGLNPHTQIHDDTHPAASAHGRDPGRSARPRWAYASDASVTEEASPHRQYSQPSRLPGSRD